MPLDLDGAALSEAEALLSPDERARADRFRFPVDRRRFVLAKAQLRAVLGRALHLQPREVRLRIGEWGKPSLDPAVHREPLQFNLSHSGEWAAIALHENSAVGVDLEMHRATRDLEGLADSVFSPAERTAWNDLAEPDRAEAFFTVWTRKEALFKAWGGGLNHSLREVTVTFGEAVPPVCWQDTRWCVTSVMDVARCSLALSMAASALRLRPVRDAHLSNPPL